MNKKGITHLIINGNQGTGKKTQLECILLGIYKTKENLKKHSLIINCGEGKGINFIRDKLTFFAKLTIHKDENTPFKSIILLNADSLTIEAQSVLRRSIELYSNSTRFFITTTDIDKIMLPIQSRFYTINIYDKNYYIKNNNRFKNQNRIKMNLLKKELPKLETKIDCMEKANLFYNQGIHSIDILNYIFKYEENEENAQLCCFFDIVKSNIKNEELIIFIILFSYLRKFDYLEMFQNYNEDT